MALRVGDFEKLRHLEPRDALRHDDDELDAVLDAIGLDLEHLLRSRDPHSCLFKLAVKPLKRIKIRLDIRQNMNDLILRHESTLLPAGDEFNESALLFFTLGLDFLFFPF